MCCNNHTHTHTHTHTQKHQKNGLQLCNTPLHYFCTARSPSVMCVWVWTHVESIKLISIYLHWFITDARADARLDARTHTHTHAHTHAHTHTLITENLWLCLRLLFFVSFLAPNQTIVFNSMLKDFGRLFNLPPTQPFQTSTYQHGVPVLKTNSDSDSVW